MNRALEFEFLTAEEGQFLFKNAPTAELMYVANELERFKARWHGNWQIDRNVHDQCSLPTVVL